jgi:hypothetical protein
VQTWDVNSISLCATKFSFISSIVLPSGGPEEVNIQAQWEQPQPSIRFTETISRAMPNYSFWGGQCAKWDCIVSISM